MRESKLWFWHIIAAIAVVVLLGMHMGIMHVGEILNFVGIGDGDAVKSANVFHRSQQAFFMATYILLLGAALFHGFYGLRSMLFELSLSRGLEKAVSGICAVAGIGLFLYGSYAAIYVFRMKEVLP